MLGDAPRWLVVCHGMALDHRDLLPTAERLAGAWRVLVWDMPGHGDSADPKGPVNADAMADALERVLGAAGVERAVFLGFSFGGIVAQIFAKRHPQRVAALIAYGCHAAFGQPAILPRALVPAVIWWQFGRHTWPAIQAGFARLCSETPAGQVQVAAATARIGKPLFLAMARALLTAGRPDAVLRLECAVLLLAGEHDANAAQLKPAFAALAAANPQAVRATIPGAGHCAHLDAPADFAAQVDRFLAAQP